MNKALIIYAVIVTAIAVLMTYNTVRLVDAELNTPTYETN